MKTIKIIKSGSLTTVQDLGRTGYQEFGIPVSGAMDLYSFQLANLLVGNDRFAPSIEITFYGPTIEFQDDTTFAITGAQSIIKLNTSIIGMNKTTFAKKGDILEFTSPQNGCRMYMAFHGGIYVPQIMHSSSTHMRAKLGGFEGRRIQDGDIIFIKKTEEFVSYRELPKDYIVEHKNEIILRVILGPDTHMFEKEGILTFLNNSYNISEQSDRMGYKLNGPPILHNSGADIISSPVNFGTIQVPADGYPIIMMSDRQTTGGYTRIGNVISVDLPSLAQLRPGGIVRFEEISITKAQELLKSQEEVILYLQKSLNESDLHIKNSQIMYKFIINGKNYDVSISTCDI